jgi:hypothetical protein
MRRLAVAATAAMILAGTAAAQPRYRLIIGEKLPDLELPRVDGSSRLRLRTLLGQPLAISFFSRYCAPCRRELPILQRVIERVNRGLPPRRQVLPLIISLDSRLDTKAQVHLGPSLRWLLDPEGLARAQLDPRTYPCTFLVDASGRVRHINRGFGSGYEVRVERWLRGMLVGTAIEAR